MRVVLDSCAVTLLLLLLLRSDLVKGERAIQCICPPRLQPDPAGDPALSLFQLSALSVRRLKAAEYTSLKHSKGKTQPWKMINLTC